MTQTNLHEVQSPNETNHAKEQAPFMTPVTLKKEDDTAIAAPRPQRRPCPLG